MSENTSKKMLLCKEAIPLAACPYIMRGDTVEAVMKDAAAHAPIHGVEVTPEFAKLAQSLIKDDA